MITYKTPVDEYNFLLHDFLKISQQNIQSFSELNKDFTTEIFKMAGKLASDVLLPINRIGDIEGCKLENDTVITQKVLQTLSINYEKMGGLALIVKKNLVVKVYPHQYQYY